ncbi:hypothetical protein AURDEDRAFT_115715 [Auricularia subglabra TFB-10046 SS5]|uniref:Uncharacterized protein n=1 Tax=Auricularia subglabra (strain TFB-10046 / SS5) TaxID=717982 RepID=J0WY66_AURST|nr:hypothetical protein AURDEDRAFT_115715 [Auricularia subglabra TFB-10046 SS5]
MKVSSVALFAFLPLLAAALPVGDIDAARPMRRGGLDWSPAPVIKLRMPGTPVARSKPSPSSYYRRAVTV